MAGGEVQKQVLRLSLALSTTNGRAGERRYQRRAREREREMNCQANGGEEAYYLGHTLNGKSETRALRERERFISFLLYSPFCLLLRALLLPLSCILLKGRVKYTLSHRH